MQCHMSHIITHYIEEQIITAHFNKNLPSCKCQLSGKIIEKSRGTERRSETSEGGWSWRIGSKKMKNKRSSEVSKYNGKSLQ